MDGQQLAFFLKRAGIRYGQFGEAIGKSRPTIQRWVSGNEHIGEIYALILEKTLTPKIYAKLEQEWEVYQKEYHW